MSRLVNDLEQDIPNIRHSLLSALAKLHWPAEAEIRVEQESSLRVI